MLSQTKPIVDALLSAGFQRDWFEARVPRIEKMRDGKTHVEYGEPQITLKFSPAGLTRAKLASLIIPVKASPDIHITIYQTYSQDGRHEVLWYATRIQYSFGQGGLSTVTIFPDNSYSTSVVLVGDRISYFYLSRELL